MKNIALKRQIYEIASSYQSDNVHCLSIRKNAEELIQNYQNSFFILYQRDQNKLIVKNNLDESIVLNYKDVVFCAPETFNKLSRKSNLTNAFLIVFSKKLIRETIKENKLTKNDQKILFNSFSLINSSPWLKSLLEQFFYETIIMMESPPGCTFFLEKQIINEIMRCLFTNYYIKKENTGKTNVSPEIYEVIKFIESNLSNEKLSVKEIAKDHFMSESTLLRKFKASTNQTPQQYIKSRRLENAYSYIKNDKISVSEACFMVGYSDFASFSKSFKSKFGILPSKL